MNLEKLNGDNLQTAVWESLHDPSAFSVKVDEDMIKSCYSASNIQKFVTVLFASAAIRCKAATAADSAATADSAANAALLNTKLVRLIDGLVKESQVIFYFYHS